MGTARSWNNSRLLFLCSSVRAVCMRGLLRCKGLVGATPPLAQSRLLFFLSRGKAMYTRPPDVGEERRAQRGHIRVTPMRMLLSPP